MTFFDECIAFCGPVWERWIHHPWIEALFAGTLSEKQFNYWMVQNLSYLGNTVAELAYPKVPAHSKWITARQEYKDHSQDSRVELRLIEEVGEFALTRWAARPARDGLVNFWVRTCYEGTFGDICCAFYVCHSFPVTFGERYKRENPPNLPAVQKEWVEQWIDPLVEKQRQATLAGINEYGAKTTEYERKKMKWHFLRGTQYQIGTFDAAWNLSDPWYGEGEERSVVAGKP